MSNSEQGSTGPESTGESTSRAAQAAGQAASRKITSDAARKAVAGGTSIPAGANAGAGAVAKAGEAAQAIKNKDAVGAADAAVRGAATGLAAATLSPAGGAVVSAALDSKAGRKLSRGATLLLIGAGIAAIVLPIVLAMVLVLSVTTSISQILSNNDAGATAMEGVYMDVCSVVLPPLVEPTGTEEDEANGEDVITPAEAEEINAELMAREYPIADNIPMLRPEVEDFQEKNCLVSIEDLGANGYVIAGVDLDSPFTDGEIVFPNTELAIRRALMFVGNAQLACNDGMCLSQCDGLAGEIWGYANSGFASANTHWQHAVANGYARPGDTEPPLGALLYWDTNHRYGHVATYVGNGMVVSNLTTAPGVSNVYLMPAAQWNQWHDYRGWSAPVFRGVPRANAGFDR